MRYGGEGPPPSRQSNHLFPAVPAGLNSGAPSGRRMISTRKELIQLCRARLPRYSLTRGPFRVGRVGNAVWFDALARQVVQVPRGLCSDCCVRACPRHESNSRLILPLYHCRFSLSSTFGDILLKYYVIQYLPCSYPVIRMIIASSLRNREPGLEWKNAGTRMLGQPTPRVPRVLASSIHR